MGICCRALATTALVAALLAAACPAAAQNGDYLTPNLRARVEKLKTDVAAEPGNPNNLPERARVLWQWANAYALDGGYLPVNLTQAVAAVFAYEDLAARRPELLDDYVRELTLLDEHQDALGSLTADLGPYEARAWVTIRQTYTVGSRPVQTGGGFVVARHFMPNYGRWQTTDPKADNYISISSSNGGASFAVDHEPMSGMHGEFRGVSDTLMFRLAAGELEPGDTVTITYGDTSGGSRGFLMADFSSDRMPLPLYLSFGGKDPVLYSLPIQPIVVTGTRFAGLHGFAPSVVTPGEPFTVSVRAEDRYRNRAIDGHPPLELLLDGEVVRELPPSGEAITLVDDLEIDTPGVHRFSIRTRDHSVTGTVNPMLVDTDPPYRIYWGDTHGHSGFAEGIVTPERFMRWARDDARLDYVTHSEHDVWLDDAEWQVLKDNVRRSTEEGQFIAYLGYEWTVRNIQGGHHNVLYRTPDRRDRIAAQFFPTLSALYQGLRASANPRDVLIIPHAHQAGDYRMNDPDMETLVEIMSQHGNFEWFGRMYLNHGHQVGFTAASDNHLSQPGYTAPNNASLAQRGGLGAVLAGEKTTDALFDAMKSLSAYATSGERIILDFQVNGTGMGQRAPFAEQRHITGRVVGTAPIDAITLVRNDEDIWTKDYSSETADRVNDTETLLLSFASDSHPVNPGDNPRGWRHWRGTLRVVNGTLERAEGQDFHNEAVQSLNVSEDDPNLIDFATITRGDTSSILLRVSNARRSTEIRLELEPAMETGGAPPLYRPPQETPAAELSLELKDMERGRVRRPAPIPGYEDSVTLRRVITDGPMDVSFEVDDERAVQGDYYFVRVRQVDDSLAWSSPVWVGGYPSR